MKCDEKMMRLYAVTDRTWTNETDTLYVQVEKALQGGVTSVQLREKKLNDADFLTEAFEIKSLCKKYNVPFFINDNVEIAIKCEADGVHVGQNDMRTGEVRQKIGKKMMLGISVQTVKQALEAEKYGADYLGVGAVFATSTKSDADSVDHKIVKEIGESVSIPLVVIGGIYKHNIMELKGLGISGVALVSAIFASENIENECKELKELSEIMVGK